MSVPEIPILNEAIVLSSHFATVIKFMNASASCCGGLCEPRADGCLFISQDNVIN